MGGNWCSVAVWQKESFDLIRRSVIEMQQPPVLTLFYFGH